jgi:hypothetical protein
MQQSGFGETKSLRAMLGHLHGRQTEGFGETPMYYVAAALLVLSGLFYSASHHELGQFGADVCTYGNAFCDNPVVLFTGAALAAAWGMFVSIK